MASNNPIDDALSMGAVEVENPLDDALKMGAVELPPPAPWVQPVSKYEPITKPIGEAAGTVGRVLTSTPSTIRGGPSVTQLTEQAAEAVPGAARGAVESIGPQAMQVAKESVPGKLFRWSQRRATETMPPMTQRGEDLNAKIASLAREIGKTPAEILDFMASPAGAATAATGGAAEAGVPWAKYAIQRLLGPIFSASMAPGAIDSYKEWKANPVPENWAKMVKAATIAALPTALPAAHAELGARRAGAMAERARTEVPMPEIPTDAGPVRKGLAHPAEESAAVLAQEYPPPFKPAREAAETLQHAPRLPEREPMPPVPQPPIPSPSGVTAMTRQESQLGATAGVLPERLMGLTPYQRRLRSELGPYADILPSRITEPGRPMPEIPVTKPEPTMEETYGPDLGPPPPEPAPPLRLYHWSTRSDLSTLEPKFYGTGKPGAELRRKANYGEEFPDRTYFTDKPVPPEAGFGPKTPSPHLYSIDIPSDRIYDLTQDPEGLFRKNYGDITVTEGAIKERGYLGYKASGGNYAIFEPTETLGRNLKPVVSRVSTELAFGEGAPYSQEFPQLESLPYDTMSQVTQEVVGPVASKVAKLSGVEISTENVGPGGWAGGVNPSFQFKVRGVPEAVENFADAIGHTLQQTEVWTTDFRRGASGQGLIYANPKLADPNVAREFFVKMQQNGAEGLIEGFSPHSRPGIRIVNPGGKWTPREMAEIDRAASIAADLLDLGKVDNYEVAAETRIADNNWKENPNGGNYKARLAARGRSDLLGALDSDVVPETRQRITEAIRKYSGEEAGVPGAPNLAEPRRLGAEAVEQIRAGAEPVPVLTRLSNSLDQLANEAMQRIRSRTGVSGPEAGSAPMVADIADLGIWGAAKIAKGVVEWAEWAQEMIADFGDGIRPRLEKIYKRSQWFFSKQVERLGEQQEFPTLRTLDEMFARGEAGQDWYARARAEIRKLFGPDWETFTKIYAAVSPQQGTEGNLTLALKAYGQLKSRQKLNPMDFNRDTIARLQRIAAGELKWARKGPKIESFADNLLGDESSVTVDRWMARLFGFGDKFTPQQYKFMDYLITQAARRKGVTPAQYQAALWTMMKEAAIEAGDPNFTTGSLAEVIRTRLRRMDPALVEALDRPARKWVSEEFQEEAMQQAMQDPARARELQRLADFYQKASYPEGRPPSGPSLRDLTRGEVEEFRRNRERRLEEEREGREPEGVLGPKLTVDERAKRAEDLALRLREERERRLEEELREEQDLWKKRSEEEARRREEDRLATEEMERRIQEEERRRNKPGERGSVTIPVAEIRHGLRQAYQSAQRELIDRYSDIRRFVGEELTAESDPYIAARLYSGRGGKVLYELRKLRSIVKPAYKEGILNDAMDYGLAERYEELLGRDITELPGGLTAADVQAQKAAIESRLGQRGMRKVNRFLDQLRGFQDDVLQLAVDSGVIGKKGYQMIKAANEKYLPLQRLAYLSEADLENLPIGSTVFSVGKQDLVKSIKGSELGIRDPLESIVQNVYKAISLAGRNEVARRMADLAGNPKFQRSVIRLRGGKGAPDGMEKFSAFVDGQKQDFAAPTIVVQAMRNLNSKSADFLSRFAAKSGAMLRSGATSFNAAFILRNAWRDYQTAKLVSDAGITPLDWLRGISAAMLRTKAYDEYLNSGAAFGGFMESFRKLPESKEYLTGQVTLGKVAHMVNPFEMIRLAGEIIELGPRVGLYQRALRVGKTPEEAAFISRNATIDFSRAGHTGQVLNLWVPFLNARIQGNVNVFMAVKNRPVRSAMVLGAYVGLPILATHANNTQNYPEIWNKIAQFEKDNNFIVIYGDTLDDDGNPTQVVKIPKGDVGRIFGNPFENFLDWMFSEKHKDYKELALQISSDISPVEFEYEGKPSMTKLMSSTVPPTAKAALEWATNKNFYTQREIVPFSMQQASPEQQYKKSTSPLAVRVGEFLGISPLQLENAIGTQFGGLGRQILHPTKVPKQILSTAKGARAGTGDINEKLLEQYTTEETDTRIIARRKAEGMMERFEKMLPSERRLEFIRGLQSGEIDERTIKALDDLLERKATGITWGEQMLRSRPAAVRAKYIMMEARQADPATRDKMLQNWIDKKIITDAVIDEMAKLASSSASAQ